MTCWALRPELIPLIGNRTVTPLLLYFSRYATGAGKSKLNKEDRRCSNQITGNTGFVCMPHTTTGTFNPNPTCEYSEVHHEIK